MCSILCVSSLWHSEEDAFVNIVTEIIAKYLIWTPFRVHDLSSRSEGGMNSTDPYLTIIPSGMTCSPPFLDKMVSVDQLWFFHGRRQRFPKSHVCQNHRKGHWSISIPPESTSYHSFHLRMERERESQVVKRCGRRYVKISASP